MTLKRSKDRSSFPGVPQIAASSVIPRHSTSRPSNHAQTSKGGGSGDMSEISFRVYLTTPIDRLFSCIAAPLALRQPFNRIAEHCPGHDTAVLLKKRFFRSRIPLAYFSQHPASGLVDKVMPVLQQHLRYLERVPKSRRS